MQTVSQKQIQKGYAQAAAEQNWSNNVFGQGISLFRREGGFLNNEEIIAAITLANEYYNADREILTEKGVRVEDVRRWFVDAINERAGKLSEVNTQNLIASML